MLSAPSIANLIRKARNGRNQKDFAAEIGVSQGNLSKYERGLVNPPTKVIEHCIRIVNPAEGNVEPTADELAEKIRSSLADDEHAGLRLALSALIDGLSVTRSLTPPADPASR